MSSVTLSKHFEEVLILKPSRRITPQTIFYKMSTNLISWDCLRDVYTSTAPDSKFYMPEYGDQITASYMGYIYNRVLVNSY